jgi:hypothetical protein
MRGLRRRGVACGPTLLPTRRPSRRGIGFTIHGFDEIEIEADKLELQRAGRPLESDAQLRLSSVLVRHRAN